MIRIEHIAVLLAAAAALVACKPKTEAPGEASVDEASPAEAAAAENTSLTGLIEACHVKMTAPDQREWTTYWDPAHTRTASQNPSGVRSVHWANETEQKIARDSNTAIPLDLGCGNDQNAEPAIMFTITAFDSSISDVPLAPGTYPIARKASPAKNKPGEFIVGALLYDKAMFQATSGTLTIDRFDMQGIKGSFTIDGNEILMGSRPVHLEGTFDMPCRNGQLQGGCQSNKAEQPN
jgi:hypothetical protein